VDKTTFDRQRENKPQGHARRVRSEFRWIRARPSTRSSPKIACSTSPRASTMAATRSIASRATPTNPQAGSFAPDARSEFSSNEGNRHRLNCLHVVFRLHRLLRKWPLSSSFLKGAPHHFLPSLSGRSTVNCLSESSPPRPYPVLDFRFLFAYDSVSFQGPMVRHHELTHRVNAHGATRRPASVDIARPGIHHSLRLSRNAATLALLPSENLG
jgi:hypothetical protein